MFATMYSTQAILPEIGEGLDVSAAVAGLTVTVVVLAVALGGWVHGPLSDRIGRRRVMVASAALLVVPTRCSGSRRASRRCSRCASCRALLMPGLLVVAVPYVTERFSRRGAGPGDGRVHVVAGAWAGSSGGCGPALLTGWIGWRAALSVLALPVAAATLAMWRWLPADAGHRRRGRAAPRVRCAICATAGCC